MRFGSRDTENFGSSAVRMHMILIWSEPFRIELIIADRVQMHLILIRFESQELSRVQKSDSNVLSLMQLEPYNACSNYNTSSNESNLDCKDKITLRTINCNAV